MCGYKKVTSYMTAGIAYTNKMLIKLYMRPVLGKPATYTQR